MKKNKKKKFILGIQCFATMDSGACIMESKGDNKIYDYVAISEERLIRKKHPYTFPLHSIKYCMDYFKLKSLDEIDLVVSDIIREPVWHRSGPSYNVKEFDYIKKILNLSENKIVQINHHLAHAASVYYTSGFKNSAILIVDGNGTDLETNSFYEGKNNKIKLVDKYKGRGIGIVYNVITKDCLNLGTGGEGKTMGLAPFGGRSRPILNFSKVRYKGIVTDYSSVIRRMPFSDIITFSGGKKIKKLNIKLPKRSKNTKILQNKWKQIAFDLQNETEKCLIHLGKEIRKKIKSNNICLAGGVALNSVANQKLFDNTKFKKIFVYPACSDAGIPFGLCIWALYNHPKFNIKKKRKIFKLKNAYTGITYNNKKIKKILRKYKIKSEKINLKKVAKFISSGKIIGWFQNGSEYGPRALGNRSILADSRNPEMQDIVNKKVKHRESFRPFAPAVIEEDYKKYFKLKNPSPYMLLVAKVINPKLIPSVTHVDGTARVQTVNKHQNEIFYNLIKRFKEITGVSCILNTSFNDAGEPIVETPEDALIGMLNSKIDYLVLGNHIVNSKNVDKSVKFQMIKDRSKKIKLNEQNIIKSFTKNYNKNEKMKYFNKQKKIAFWNTVVKPYADLKEQIQKWIKDRKKIIFYGTYDETSLLIKKFKELKNLDIVGFLPYKKFNEDINNKKKIKIPLRKIKKINGNLNKHTEILISSYEFCYDIERELNTRYPSIKYFKYYKGYSREISNYFNLK